MITPKIPAQFSPKTNLIIFRLLMVQSIVKRNIHFCTKIRVWDSLCASGAGFVPFPYQNKGGCVRYVYSPNVLTGISDLDVYFYRLHPYLGTEMHSKFKFFTILLIAPNRFRVKPYPLNKKRGVKFCPQRA